MTNAILFCGDALDLLRDLPDGIVHCVVTSPPYWGLRDYGHQEQIGSEKSAQQYVERLTAVFREVRRVLRDDGTVWLNIGDSYQGGNLLGVPWQVAFAAQNNGWVLRRDNVWAKPNPMPEPANGWRWERCRVKVRQLRDGSEGPIRDRGDGGFSGGVGGIAAKPYAEYVDCQGCQKCEATGGLILRRSSWRCTTSHEYVFQLTKSGLYYSNAEAAAEDAIQPIGKPKLTKQHKRAQLQDVSSSTLGTNQVSPKRNPRSVWTITTKPYKGAHFAVFPPELPERCILASTSADVCAQCGSPWAPFVEVESDNRIPYKTKGTGDYGVGAGRNDGGANQSAKVLREDGRGGDLSTQTRTTIAYLPTCSCGTVASVPATVLDPFCGSGTTGLVAARLGRDFIGLELNPEYVRMAAERIGAEASSESVTTVGVEP